MFTPQLESDGVLEVQVEVTNSGHRSGDEVVQLYVDFSRSQVDRPVKLLRGFQKIRLQAGETRRVSLQVPVSELAWYNPDDREWQVEQMQYDVLVGGSSAPADLLRGTFSVGQ